MTTGARYLIWLFLNPARWTQRVQQIDPALAADFCLADLGWRHVRRGPMGVLLLTSLVFVPGAPAAALGLALWPLGIWNGMALIGGLFGLCMGLLFGAVVSVAAGMMIGCITSLLLAFSWGAQPVHMFDVLIGIRLAILFGVVNCLGIHSVHILSQRAASSAMRLRARAFLTSVAVSVAVFLVVLAAILGTLVGRENYQFPGYGIGLVISVTPAVLFGMAMGWKSLSIGRGALGGALLCGLLLSLYHGLGREFGQDFGGPTLFVALMIVAVLVYCIPFLCIYAVATRMVGPWLGIVAASIGGLLVHPLIEQVVGYYPWRLNVSVACGWILLGVTMRWWRPLLFYPLETLWNTLLYRLDLAHDAAQEAGALHIARHAVFWDALQWIPFWGLDAHLVLAVEQNERAGHAAINAVSGTPQRWAAQAAQIELDARQLAACETVQAMAAIHRERSMGLFWGSANALLRTFGKISEDIGAGLAQVGIYNQRLVFSTVENELNGLLRELTRSNERYALRFQPVAAQWRDIVARKVEQLDALFEERREILNPYVVGVPLTKHQDIFVGRDDISRQIETILRNQNHPPILLYGQRRMGKTSLIYNLRWMLPNRILPLVVDLQGPAGMASEHAGFLYNLAKGIGTSARQQEIELDSLTRAELEADPFTVFDDWLDRVEATIAAQKREMILLALDEFESLDAAFTGKRLDADMILGALRHIIQHRVRFKLLLAGSHTLDEFTRWSSYLINAQMVHISYLSRAETRQLIEQPIQNFTLRYTQEATHHVIALTRGHPYLVQLLCSEIVLYKNQQPVAQRRRATKADVEVAAAEVLTRGRLFFADIANNQIPPHARRFLHGLAQSSPQNPADPTDGSLSLDTQTVQQLLHRNLIEPDNRGYRFQVELVRRWFAKP